MTVDTIRIKIEDIYGVHKHLLQVLESRAAKGVEGYTDLQKGVAVRSPNTALDLLFMKDTGRIIRKFAFMSLPSSNYAINCYLNVNENYLSINVSLPKYSYGHNVRMLLPRFVALPFAPADMVAASDYAWEECRKTVAQIFTREFGTDVIHTDLVAFDGVDLCMNHYVPGGGKVILDYIRRIKGLHFYGQHMTTDNVQPWETSFVQKGSGWLFKGYWKYPEFIKHDAQRLRAAGNMNVRALSEIADKTLRFELSLKAKRMSELVKTWKVKSDQVQSLVNKDKDERFQEIYAALKSPYANDIKSFAKGVSIPAGFSGEISTIDFKTDYTIRRMARYLAKVKIPQLKAVSYFYLTDPRTENEIRRDRLSPYSFPRKLRFTKNCWRICLFEFMKRLNAVTLSTIDYDGKQGRAAAKYAMLRERFTDAEFVKSGIYAKQSIYQMRSKLRKHAIARPEIKWDFYEHWKLF